MSAEEIDTILNPKPQPLLLLPQSPLLLLQLLLLLLLQGTIAGLLQSCGRSGLLRDFLLMRADEENCARLFLNSARYRDALGKPHTLNPKPYLPQAFP